MSNLTTEEKIYLVECFFSRGKVYSNVVPPPSRNAIPRPFTTNVSDARTAYVTRGTDMPKAGSDFIPWVRRIEELIRSKYSKESLNSDLYNLINEDECINSNCINNESDSSCSSIEYYLFEDDFNEASFHDNNT
ncbi:hypothetical protein X777_08321 [Ooceraea biroi]|uniref:DUF4817 domain-containing protein n=1 Tax=Ooceraea biroi TaxID=2015173 RepID=A0A026X176_OOCBI|nr:hypothetical protein X777_08321 [Ooceraea biroi]